MLTIHHQRADAKILRALRFCHVPAKLSDLAPSGVAFDARRQYWNNTAYPEPEY